MAGGRPAPHVGAGGCGGWIGACAAALDAASAIERWNSFSCCCGVVGTALAVVDTLGADVEGVEGLDIGLGALTLGADGALGEPFGALGIPGIPGSPGPAAGGGAAAGGTPTAGSGAAACPPGPDTSAGLG